MFGGDNGAQAQQVTNTSGPAGTLTPPSDASLATVPEQQPSGVPPTPNDTGARTDVSDPAGTYQTDDAPATDTTAPAPASLTQPATPTATGTDDLMDIKRQALQKLSPLVDHLNQTPGERFRTTMMMIQASDDSSLLNVAYEAAQQIADDKARAQALLDVVNEINYFTQHNGDNPENQT